MTIKHERKEDKKKIKGREIIRRIMQRDTSVGGVLCEITGIQGSGKSSMMLTLIHKIFQLHPKELVFWRDSQQSAVQFNRQNSNRPLKHQILVEAGTKKRV